VHWRRAGGCRAVRGGSLSLKTVEEVRAVLHERLDSVDFGSECVLLDYPAYPNIGDHLIWLGEVLYLTQSRGVNITYASSARDFRESWCPRNATIVFHGGGNFGDLWPDHQKFRESIIARFPDRKIVILPQTIYFRNQANLASAARGLNAHPDLTLFARCERSLATALENFAKCRVILAPDPAFHLVGILNPRIQPPRAKQALYHCRVDPEQPPGVDPDYIGLRDLHMEDWVSLRRSWKAVYWETGGRFRALRSTAKFLKGLRRELPTFRRERWSFSDWRASMPRPAAIPLRTWMMAHAGAYQFAGYPGIVTNRLHGHILALLLGIPHVFLPNIYFKNESFYQTWTKDLPGFRFVDNPFDARRALTEVSGV
jgi:pyruvyl transferase EpsO